MMKIYLQAFMNFEQNDEARLLTIAKFVYNYAKNVNINFTPFQLNCSYHSRMFFEKNIDFCPRLKPVNKLALKLQQLLIVCQKNLYYA